ncbi:trans-sulfuration enzyme family protein [Methanobrevibacter filiformis]|uniref:Cystathionine beta-lyase n=1 Tax=Methanobrevibacter filiformis TaxID=55758 RepID=A0A166CG57_9EURY|nr:PLP-dependent aspartate aminotransferase family protein [Methanobrevibacter filiformis]KZX14475.1 cystathionine beta-lyase [Methanobrevibacter filiformis]
MTIKKNKMNTKLIHGGISEDPATGALSIPIYQSATFKQIELGKTTAGYEYGRSGNPTRDALESLIADLENGSDGFAFASGLAAITTVLFLFKSGDRILISQNVYGGTFRILDEIFNNFDLEYEIIDTENLEKYENVLKNDENIRGIIIESPTNPLLTVTDLNEISKISKKYNVLTIVDNTFMTPYLQKPLDLGADIVVHSGTKYLGGHSDVVSGLLVVNDKKLAEKLRFLQNSTGGILEPFDSWLLIRGIKTLSVRMDRHIENAKYIANVLKNSEAVNEIYFPGDVDFKGYQIQKKQAKGPGGMISFTLKEDYNINEFFKNLKIITLAESLGGVESLVSHPVTMTHACIPKNILEKIGIGENLIRLSVGIEDKEDLVEDLLTAIKKSKNKIK